MRNSFKGFYIPSDSEFETLWKDGVFVFDANVLLNLYRYSSKAREQLLDILKSITQRIWIPHQAAYEYQKQRINVINQQHAIYNDLNKQLTSFSSTISNRITGSKQPVIHETEELFKQLTEITNQIIDKLEQSKKNELNFNFDGFNDDVRDFISHLFEGKVGRAYNTEYLEKIYDEGKLRYQNNIPPGFKDKDKNNNEQYGDLVLWYQIIDYAKLINKPIIFITDDTKDDWWQKIGDKKIPHPRLVEEIYNKAQTDFYMYTSDRFMHYAEKNLQSTVNAEVINEVREILNKPDHELASVFSIDSVNCIINSNTVIMDSPVYLNTGTPFISVRYLAEALDIENVMWDAQRGTLILIKNNRVIQLNKDSRKMFVDGQEVVMPFTPVMKEDRLTIPIVLISKLFGAEAYWDKDTNTITIIK